MKAAPSRARLGILWLSHLVPYPPRGGVLQRSFNLLRSVAERHDVHLLAFNQRALLPTAEALERSVVELRRFCASVHVLPIPSDERPLGRQRTYLRSLVSARPFTARWLHSKDMEGRIREILARHHIDLAHVDTISLATFARLLANYGRVLNHNGVESQMMAQRASLERNPAARFYMAQEAWKLRRYETAVCGAFDLNVTCSCLDSTRLAGHVPGVMVEEIPNGVDLSYFRPTGGQEEERSLVAVGGMTWYPNRRAMIWFARDIWPLLKREEPDVCMTVIGREPPPEVVRLGQRDPAYRAVGFVEDIRPVVARAQVYVCPLRDGGGTRLKVLDALAMGKAMVAHPIAVEGIDVKPGEHVLIAETPKQFVEKIRLLFATPELRTRLAEEGRRLVEEKYDFERIGAKLNRLYDGIVARRRDGSSPGLGGRGPTGTAAF